MNNTGLKKDASNKDSLRKDYNNQVKGNFNEILGRLRRVGEAFTGSPSSNITVENIANWNLAFSWGDHDGLYLPLSGGSMSNTNLVTNLNADRVDGYHQADLVTQAAALNEEYTAYDYDIIGVRDGVNCVFTLPENYKSGSLKVYVNGMRLTKKAQWDPYDYEETSPSTITLTDAMNVTDMILIDYKKQ